jgi:hypothetical protein
VKRWKVIVALVLALATLILVLQNTDPVETQLLFTSVTMPLALLLFVTTLVGFAIGLAVSGRLTRKPSNGAAPRVQPGQGDHSSAGAGQQPWAPPNAPPPPGPASSRRV